MGIRVVCPNGHKLNVKSFLAGKKGICPHCQARFEIPAPAGDSHAPAPAPEPLGGDAELDVGDPFAGLQLDNAVTPAPANNPLTTAAPSPAADPAAFAATLNAQPESAPMYAGDPFSQLEITPELTNPIAAPTDYVPTPAAIATAAPVTVAVAADPLLEAPGANWYLRPITGGQFGPAQPEIMRQWLHEGRVSGDSLVWREGWTDWVAADTVFSQFAPVAQPAVAAPQAASGPIYSPANDQLTSAPSLSQAHDVVPRTARRTKKKGPSPMVVVCTALGIGIFLLSILAAAIYFATRDKDSKTKSARPLRTSVAVHQAATRALPARG